MDGSEANEKFFMDERMAYNIMLMSGSETPAKLRQTITLSPWMWGVAASILILLSFGTLFFINSKNTSINYSTVIVPPGQRVNIILADSTSVWLNANTSLKYPTSFFKGRQNGLFRRRGLF